MEKIAAIEWLHCINGKDGPCGLNHDSSCPDCQHNAIATIFQTLDKNDKLEDAIKAIYMLLDQPGARESKDILKPWIDAILTARNIPIPKEK